MMETGNQAHIPKSSQGTGNWIQNAVEFPDAQPRPRAFDDKRSVMSSRRVSIGSENFAAGRVVLCVVAALMTAANLVGCNVRMAAKPRRAPQPSVKVKPRESASRRAEVVQKDDTSRAATNSPFSATAAAAN